MEIRYADLSLKPFNLDIKTSACFGLHCNWLVVFRFNSDSIEHITLDNT
jgi:hypothetical protein